MKFKRKRSRRHVRCTMCTPHRNGNTKQQRPHRDLREMQRQ